MKKKMWIIAKIKNKSIEVFKNELQKKANGKVNFYQPKISFNLKFRGKSIQKTKPILENYIFCKHENFKKKDNLNKFFFIRGLKFFLDGSKFYQKEIENFIFYCKSFENEKGFIKNIFFKSIITDKGKFISGPLKNLVFDIIEKKNNKIKISMGNYFVTVDENSSNFYQPI
jgi:hypothetical protein